MAFFWLGASLGQPHLDLWLALVIVPLPVWT